MNHSIQSVCPFCPDVTLDHLGHHAVSCRHCGCGYQTQILCRILLWCAHLSISVEVGQGLSRVHSNSHLVDLLVDVWERAKPGTFYITVISPLTPATLHDACNSAGVIAHTAECQKHSDSNGPKCQELEWLCFPESYGNWGRIPSEDSQKLRLCQRYGSL